MLIGLHDAERDHMRGKTFPNFALMKLSAHHKAQGDTVEWWNGLNNAAYDTVYSSKVFDFTRENPYLPENTVKGGTGYGLYTELPPTLTAVSPITPCTPNVITPSATSRGAVQTSAGGAWCRRKREISGLMRTGGTLYGGTPTNLS